MKRLLIESLIHWKGKEDRKPLILKGARQVGKTTLLHQFGKQCFPAAHMINFEKNPGLEKIFENLDPKRIIQELEFYLYPKNFKSWPLGCVKTIDKSAIAKWVVLRQYNPLCDR